MKNIKICGKLRKMANFEAANLPLRPQKTTMTGREALSLSHHQDCTLLQREIEIEIERARERERERARERER